MTVVKLNLLPSVLCCSLALFCVILVDSEFEFFAAANARFFKVFSTRVPVLCRCTEITYVSVSA